MENVFDKAIVVLHNFLFYLKEVISTAVGWLILLMNLLVVVFGPCAEKIYWVLIAIIIDLILGSISAIKRKEFRVSTALVSTAIKVSFYTLVFFMPLAIQRIAECDLKYLSILVTILLCGAEYLSSISHMLLIKPDLWGLRLLRSFLIGEMAKKLKISYNEMIKKIEEYENRKKTN